jgi:two-component system response regulator HupR/HoxA
VGLGVGEHPLATLEGVRLDELRPEPRREPRRGTRDELRERDLSLLDGLDGSLKSRLEPLEARIIRETLVRHRWNKTHAAQELGLARVGLRSKLARYGLERA